MIAFFFLLTRYNMRVAWVQILSAEQAHMKFLTLDVRKAINGWQLAKMKKEYSWHVPAMKFIGMKQLVSKGANILEKLRNLWKWENWGNIVKIWYFVNNF